jgi:DNA-binding NarL/FixJ family response regulator
MNPDAPLRLAIVDDHALFREGIAAILQHDLHIEVVGQGASSDDAFELAQRLQPDVLLLDVEIPGDPARATIGRIRRAAPNTGVVVLTMHRDAILRDELLAAGAVEYVLKTAPSLELVRAVRRAAAIVRGTEAAGDGSPSQRLQPGRRGILSRREREVLRHIAHARSNREIAREMSIAEGTVKRHTSNIYAKLGAKSRMDAVRRADRIGLLAEPEGLGL